MALLKAIPSDFGVDATYWKIGVAEENFIAKSLTITLIGYASESARKAGKQPMAQAKYQLTGDAYGEAASRGQIYAEAKLHPEFADAQDC